MGINSSEFRKMEAVASSGVLRSLQFQDGVRLRVTAPSPLRGTAGPFDLWRAPARGICGRQFTPSMFLDLPVFVWVIPVRCEILEQVFLASTRRGNHEMMRDTRRGG